MLLGSREGFVSSRGHNVIYGTPHAGREKVSAACSLSLISSPARGRRSRKEASFYAGCYSHRATSRSLHPFFCTLLMAPMVRPATSRLWMMVAVAARVSPTADLVAYRSAAAVGEERAFGTVQR